MIWSVSMLSTGSATRRLSNARELVHSSVLTSVTTPVIAAEPRRSAGWPGRCGRRGPGGLRSSGCWWRRSTRRAASSSPFMAMHIEQPGSRHSAPASRKILIEALGLRLRASPRCEPGTMSVRTRGLTLRPFRIEAASRRSFRRPLVQLPMKTTWMGWPSSGLPLFEPHVAQRLLERRARRRIGDPRRIRDRRADRHAHARAGAEGDHRLQRDPRRSRLRDRRPRRRRSEAASSGPARRPSRRPVGANGRPWRYWKVVVVGRDQPGARAALDGHVADRHALFHRERADGRAAVLEHAAGAAAEPILAISGQDDVLGRDAAAERCHRP